jgi:nitroreductase
MNIDVENLLAAIRHRRSFKPALLKPDPIARQIIEKGLEAGRWAPTHGRTEPWEFTVFTGEGRRKLGEVFGEAYRIDAEQKGNFVQSALEGNWKKPLSAPVWIAIGMKPGLRPDGKGTMPEEEEAMAVACSMLLMHLTASALGLGAQWTSGGMTTHPHVARFVGLQPPARLLGFFYLGWPAVPWPESTRKPLAEKVRWVE